MNVHCKVERTTKRGSELNILYAVEIDFHFIKYSSYRYRWNCKRKSTYSHLFNKRGGGAKVVKSLNVEGGIFWKKLVHNSNKRGVEGGKI